MAGMQFSASDFGLCGIQKLLVHLFLDVSSAMKADTLRNKQCSSNLQENKGYKKLKDVTLHCTLWSYENYCNFTTLRWLGHQGSEFKAQFVTRGMLYQCSVSCC
jgi:hypothetical protein